MRHAARLLLGFAVLAAWPLVAATPAGALRTGTTEGQIAAAFQRLQSLPSVAQGEAYLQGYDEAMRSALQQAGTQLVAGDSGKPLTVRFRTGPVTVARPGQAMVPLTISVHTTYPPPSYSDSFDAVALRVGGRWKVSWTTMCLLVETDRQLCPPTPRAPRGGRHRADGRACRRGHRRRPRPARPARPVSSARDPWPWRRTAAC